MKAIVQLLKKFLSENGDDLKYILLIGVPWLILSFLIITCSNSEHLY